MRALFGGSHAFVFFAHPLHIPCQPRNFHETNHVGGKIVLPPFHTMKRHARESVMIVVPAL